MTPERCPYHADEKLTPYGEPHTYPWYTCQACIALIRRRERIEEVKQALREYAAEEKEKHESNN